jgi:tripartite-type tricarboxylate transporter receptor subunit TctC
MKMKHLTTMTVMRRWSLLAGSMTVATVMAFAPVASAATTPKAKSCTSGVGTKVTGASECAGLAYYKGKNMTFVAADSPGGGFDQYARDYAPYIAKYLGLASDNVLNIPAGNTVAGQNAVAGSTPNGLEVGWLNAGPDIEDIVLNVPGVQFNPEGVPMLGATAASDSAVVALKSSACAAWDHGFASLLKENTASDPVTEPIQTTGSTTYSLLLMNGVFGVHYKALPGYASSSALIAGWARGDGCVIEDPVSSLASYITSGVAVPLLLSVPLQSSNHYAKAFVGVPTFAQAVKTYSKYIKNKTQKAAVTALIQSATTPRAFFVPAKTPKNEQAILRDAFKWASDNATLKTLLLSQGNPTGYQTGAVAKANYISFLSSAKRTKEYLAAIS